MIESVILNIFTVGITSCIIPALVRWKAGSAVRKGLATAIIFVNALLMILGWVALRGQILTGDFNTQPRGGDYITYGVGLALFISWSILTTNTDFGASTKTDTQQASGTTTDANPNPSDKPEQTQ